jgi:hypothetical protein
MLICTVSFEKEALSITIHNLYPGLKLTSAVYFSNGTVCHVPPSQQIDARNTTEAIFGIHPMQKDFKGALLYKLQRKHTTKTSNYLNNGTASIEDVKKSVYLLVVWDIENYDHGFHACLIECTSDFTWDEDKLCALYKDYKYQFYEDYKSKIIAWLMNSGAVMKIGCKVTYALEYKLDIVISEETKRYNMKKPAEIDPKRSVLLLLMLIVLIYALSLPIQPSVKLSLHNQCLNVDLISPTYITGEELECYKPPDYKACVGNTISSSFIIKSGNESDGALICKLQKKRMHGSTEAGEDTSSATHLLVVWKISKSNELYVDVLLVEHDKVFDWDKDNLKYLYHKNFGRFKWFTDSATEKWLWDNDVALMITSEIMNEGQLLNVTISEVERDNGMKTPLHIDLER